MTEQLPDPAEDLSGYYAPYPPIGCAALVDAGPAQNGSGGPQGARTGAETAAEAPEAATSPQTGADGLHALLAAAILPVIERETAQLRRERDMALNTARRLRALLAQVRNVGPDLEMEATLPGMHDAAREAKRDASRRIRGLIDGTAGQPCAHCGHPGNWHDPWEGCVGPNGIGGPGSGDCTCTRGPDTIHRRPEEPRPCTIASPPQKSPAPSPPEATPTA
ncbi:hypothetical protein MUK60_07575 [Streptomyces sp. LRE541]|uniref:hypothetical protein n=1 Tax=Streptomyces sp. LRE541 TaxID=2931983 RepID=UPI00200DA809|nr:hypothetical protein [Streptomyces sp. LRE541]UPZ27693.1 hypothetical protein MUK60_07575 [Streptomyces sp. LRE541]